ncbi:MAG: hypothetical protein DI629_17210 [Mesorhizobium amorphae]|nr:MAG: hypothetical protein DI629_17210 [Mesorhizobium amorphae]
MTDFARAAHESETPTDEPEGALVYRQSIWTRLTHWVWALALFFLLLTGLNIFNAHPTLYVGQQSGFAFDNAVLAIGTERSADGLKGYLAVFGHRFDTTGVLGVAVHDGRTEVRAFPAWMTIPSYYDLASARVFHFFFAWILAGTLLVWLVASIVNGHLRRDIAPRGSDLRALPQDVADHARLRFRHGRTYNPLQKLSYAAILLVLFPLIILSGLAMSPSFNAVVPFIHDLFGGRQTARTVHFATMVLLVLFFVVHVLMVVAAGPFNEMRSMITGWYRTGRNAR